MSNKPRPTLVVWANKNGLSAATMVAVEKSLRDDCIVIALETLAARLSGREKAAVNSLVENRQLRQAVIGKAATRENLAASSKFRASRWSWLDEDSD